MEVLVELEKVTPIVARRHPELGLEAGPAELGDLHAVLGDRLAEPRVATGEPPNSLLAGSTPPGRQRRLPFQPAWTAVAVQC